MSQPVLFAIDNDAGILRALRDDLTRRFGEDFRVVAESSASMPGVLAAGDARYQPIKRVASAVGDGATVVRLAHEYLATGQVGDISQQPTG